MAAIDPDACITADELKEIIDTDLTDARLHNFINMAHYRTRRLVSELGECGGADAVCAIVKVLAAHFLTMFQQQTKSESVGGEWSVTFRGQDGLQLNTSLYGQQAIAMDCSGILAKAGMKQARFRVISYDDLELLEPDTVE